MGTVVILGAGAGFGMAIARAFAQQGDHPILVARHADSLKKRCAQLHTEDLPADYLVADCTDAAQTATMFDDVQNRWDLPTTLVYNVADTSLDNPLESQIDEISHRFAVNVLGAISTIRQFIALTPDDTPRTVLVTGGGAALHPGQLTTSLSLTKAALRSYVFSLAPAVKKRGVYVGLITIQGISGTSTEMEPVNVAQAYTQAARERTATEIFYPGGEPNATSEFDQLQALTSDPEKLYAFLEEHAGAAAFIRSHPGCLKRH
ncbi:short-chain dehydrogenase reductase SDR [Levilactobacillus senmaizukei DSM 21775 = NBRC 103853]|uniref:Short-chain dehydrogenase reductase SDR n=1 Tax=Levilactobacillus senmaizukei DSM 21775 = NBRC 103853 TaxID=1423803 RepID=A0A0R2DH38_9LACO|nr:SDR family NAD(P)-dependent oxidoreductase [Levilactobacillus senmaizukei]KRN02315.1 short-chain dehydrogenase reductase SDR [Levilactobacillus senmaizukei DSM 21775 = NBRC 103853]